MVSLLRRNINSFSWEPFDILGKDTRVVCHRLTIDPTVKLVSQKKHKVGEENRAFIDEEVHKLISCLVGGCSPIDYHVEINSRKEEFYSAIIIFRVRYVL